MPRRNLEIDWTMFIEREVASGYCWTIKDGIRLIRCLWFHKEELPPQYPILSLVVIKTFSHYGSYFNAVLLLWQLILPLDSPLLPQIWLIIFIRGIFITEAPIATIIKEIKYSFCTCMAIIVEVQIINKVAPSLQSEII